MKMTKIGLMLACVTALAACDMRPKTGDDTGYSGANANGAGVGGVNDPSSVAYFNQTIGDRVLFLVDQHTLTPVAMQTLDGQANWLQQNSTYSVTIEGHADETGTREYNLALGARRANSVRDYLVSRGVAESRIDTVTYGKERPLAICSNEECWSKNRRAVTLVATGLTS
ncbi:peptidoglycan-associated lipoprotein Pal [Neptunicoccus cionae]|uniref:peptidoglycan-associated lipoprotein Pal n=1 Tax=Neptunicoccus cionae TaxID=2035344 RepID=UPI000C785406|nr:peptidoglycan-associated lipoprotein Pal [Amylibacter cionae]PLS23348.1 peptidoglycan-associated lipoprotein [Amylibacter cionae]